MLNSRSSSVQPQTRMSLNKEIKHNYTTFLDKFISKEDPNYDEFQHFINKKYFESYAPKPQTIFELCQHVKDDSKQFTSFDFKNRESTLEVALWLK